MKCSVHIYHWYVLEVDVLKRQKSIVGDCMMPSRCLWLFLSLSYCPIDIMSTSLLFLHENIVIKRYKYSCFIKDLIFILCTSFIFFYIYKSKVRLPPHIFLLNTFPLFFRSVERGDMDS